MRADMGRDGHSARLPSDNSSDPTNNGRKIRTHFHFWGIQLKSNLKELGLVVNTKCHAAFCKWGSRLCLHWIICVFMLTLSHDSSLPNAIPLKEKQSY